MKATDCVKIGRGRDRSFAANLLGSHVKVRADGQPLIGYLSRSSVQCDAEIAEFDQSRAVEINVRRLQISMHDAMIMDVLQSRAKLPAALQRFFNPQLTAFLQQLFQRPASNDFHAVKQPVAVEAVVVTRDDVWMVELVQNLDLSLEPKPDGLVLRNCRLQDFQSNLATVCAINSAANRAHGSDAERLAKLKRLECFMCHGVADRSLKRSLRKCRAVAPGFVQKAGSHADVLSTDAASREPSATQLMQISAL